MADLRCLTRVGHAKPGGWSHNVTTGICASLVSIATGVVWQKVGQSKDVANQPNHHDGEDDLKEAWFIQMERSPSTSPGFCSLYLQETFWISALWWRSGPSPCCKMELEVTSLSGTEQRARWEKCTCVQGKKEREREIESVYLLNMQHSS